MVGYLLTREGCQSPSFFYSRPDALGTVGQSNEPGGVGDGGV